MSDHLHILDGKGVAYGAFEQLTVTNSVAVACTAAKIVDQTHGHFYAEDSTVRWRLDGQADPTSDVGFPMNKDGMLDCDSQDQLSKVKFIKKGGGSATVWATYGTR